MAKTIKETDAVETQASTPNRDRLAAIYEAYKKERPDKYELFKDEYARNLGKSEAEIGLIIK